MKDRDTILRDLLEDYNKSRIFIAESGSNNSEVSWAFWGRCDKEIPLILSNDIKMEDHLLEHPLDCLMEQLA